MNKKINWALLLAIISVLIAGTDLLIGSNLIGEKLRNSSEIIQPDAIQPDVIQPDVIQPDNEFLNWKSSFIIVAFIIIAVVVTIIVMLVVFYNVLVSYIELGFSLIWSLLKWVFGKGS